MEIIKTILGTALSYLIGSIPTAYIFGRLLKNVDIRQFGSGNVGATNAFRVLGKVPGSFVLIIDVLKGLFAVIFVASIFKQNVVSREIYLIFLGTASVCGHIWTIFLKGKGGKGMATSFGAFIGLVIKIPGLKIVFILVVLTWVAVFLMSRIVSLASIISGINLPIFLIIFKQSPALIVMGFFLFAIITFRHKSNIIRMLQKKEPRVNLPFFK